MDNAIEQQNAHSNDHLNMSFNRNPHSFHSLPNHLVQHQHDVSNLTMNSPEQQNNDAQVDALKQEMVDKLAAMDNKFDSLMEMINKLALQNSQQTKQSESATSKLE
jgi:hypothetical protein